MGILEIQGGPITHKHLMQKTKDDLAHELNTSVQALRLAKKAATSQSTKIKQYEIVMNWLRKNYPIVVLHLYDDCGQALKGQNDET